jgi:hypothetical protein
MCSTTNIEHQHQHQHYLSFLVKKLDNIDLQHCNCCHLLSGFPSKKLLSMMVIHYKNVRMQNVPKVDELKGMTTFVNLFIRSVIRKLTILT